MRSLKCRNLLLYKGLFFRLLVFGSFVLQLSSWVSAQIAPTPSGERSLPFPVVSSETTRNPAGPRLEQAPLDAIILFNPTGRQATILPGGWPLEVLDDFSRFLLKDQQLPISPYTIQGISVRGRVNQRRIEATVRLVLTTSSTRAIRVPLGMNEGILPFQDDDEPEERIEDDTNIKTTNDAAMETDETVQKTIPMRYIGPGTCELLIDPADGQYVALIQPGNATNSNLTDDTRRQTDRKESENENESTSRQDDARNSMTDSDEDESVDSTTASEKSGIAQTTATSFFAKVNSMAVDVRPSDAQHDWNATPQRHELTLSFWFPVAKISDDENRLTVSFPQAISSQFVLTVPTVDAVANVSQGSLLDVLKSNDPETTRFNILGLKPNFEISWRRQKTEKVEERPVLRVEDASIIARIETRSIVYEANLPVRSAVGSFDRFHIRLPLGAVLDQDEMEKHAVSGGYSFRMLPKEEWDDWSQPSNEGISPAPVLEVRLPKKTNSLTGVRVKAVQYSSEKPSDWRQIGGFEVLEAKRQRGYLALSIPPEMRAHWVPVRNVRRVELPSSLAQVERDAGFEIFAQPFSLRCQIVLPKTRINVRPEYQVQVNKGTMSMTMNFSYFVHGAKAEKLAVRLFDWQWSGSDVRASNLIDVDGVMLDDTGLMSIPLRSPSEGEFDLEFKVHRALNLEELRNRRIIVQLPQPDADWVEPAAPFVVVPADNIEILPVDGERLSAKTVASTSDSTILTDGMNSRPNFAPKQTIGLTRRTRRTVPLRIALPGRQQDPLVYQTESPRAVFVADIQSHGQEIRTTIQADVRLLDRENQVTEMITFDVSYEPIDRILLGIPAALAQRDDIRVSLGGKALELHDAVAPSDAFPASEIRKRIILPEAMIGRFQLVVQYGIPPLQVVEDLVNTVSLSFVRPLDVETGSHQVNLIVPAGVQIELHDGDDKNWKESGKSSGFGISLASGRTAFVAPEARDELALRVSSRDVLGTMVVERSWVQTWLTQTTRVDRALYQIIGNRETVVLKLPAGVTQGRFVVKRDNLRMPLALSPSGELTIPLGPDQKGKPVLLDIWYEIPARLRHNVRIELPKFADDSLIRCEYWQVILPPGLHVVNLPKGWMPEYHWGWNRYFVGRIPSMSMEDIGLTDALSDQAKIPDAANQYLYSNIRSAPYVSLTVVDRAIIVLISSSLALLVGLVLIYFPKTRHVGSLFGLLVALFAMILYQPAPILLMLQASVLGVLLALLANYLYRIVYRDESWVVPPIPSWSKSSHSSKLYSVIIDDDSEPIASTGHDVSEV